MKTIAALAIVAAAGSASAGLQMTEIFPGVDGAGDGADWFGSGASFDREAFEWLWEDVANVLIESARLDG